MMFHITVLLFSFGLAVLGCGGGGSPKFSDDKISCLIATRKESNGMKWYTLFLSRDSREGVTSFRSKILLTDAHVESWRKKRAVPLFCRDFEYGTELFFTQVMHSLIREQRDGIGGILTIWPNDRQNPIETSYMREIAPGVRRVEALEALILPRHKINNRTEFPNKFFDNMKTLGYLPGEDDRFHLVASDFSGPPELYNMIPGHQSLNGKYEVLPEGRMNDWRSVERAIRYHIHFGGSVGWKVLLFYDNMSTGRPDHITYLARFYDWDGNRKNFILGGSRNYQL